MTAHPQILASIAAAALIAPAGAAAAVPTWHTGLPIAPERTGLGAPASALGRAGEGLGAWVVAPPSSGTARMEVRARHGHRAPWRLELARPAGALDPDAVAAAMSPAGVAAVAWTGPQGGVRVASRRGPRALWTVAGVPLGAPGAGGATRLRVAVADDGSAHLVVAAREGGGWTVRSADRAGPAAVWRAGGALAAGPAPLPPNVAVAPDGTAVAAWASPAPGPQVRTALRTSSGAWSAAAALGEGVEPVASIARGGGALVAWTAGGLAPQAVAATGDAETGAVTALAPVAPGHAAAVAIGSDAGALLALSPPEGGIAAVLGPAGVLAAPVVRHLDRPAAGPAPGPQSSAAAALSATGLGVVTWLERDGPGATARMAAAHAGAPWRRADEPVAEDAGAPAVATAGDEALVLARALGRPGGGRTVLAASYDAGPRARLAGTVRSRPPARWSFTVRNPSRIAAQGVVLGVTLPSGARIARPLPAGARVSGRTVTVPLGTLGAGARRAICLTVRPGEGPAAPPTAEARAVAVPPTTLRGV